MKGFQDRFTDLPDYILQITREIWEGRGLATLEHYYAPELPMRFSLRHRAGQPGRDRRYACDPGGISGS